VDNVDNAGAQSVTFSVTVTADSLAGDVTDLEGLGCIDDIGQSLLAKIGAAQSLAATGQIQPAVNVLEALVHEAQAQAGRHISTACHDPSGRPFDAAQLLIGDAQYLETTLGD
jgi:hypothetical protein